jgi:butyrate kinase
MFYILTINPGSTSTKVAIFKLRDSLQQLVYQNIEHSNEMLEKCKNLIDQLELRTHCILDVVTKNHITKINCIVSRGGLLQPVSAGSYAINSKMLDDLTNNRYGTHASNLGALIANELSKKFHCQAMIVDPVSVDEFSTLARYSGFPNIERRSQSHALNIRATARLAAKDLGLTMETVNFVIAHLGGGISVVPLQRGRIIDVNDANDGGPFSPQRAGSLPITQLVTLAYSGKYKTDSDLIRKLTRESGLVGYLGTDNGREIIARINNGDEKAAEVFKAMAYQIAKEIGAMATVLQGVVTAVVITGGLARLPLVDWIKESIAWIAPIIVYPGEHEQAALAEAGKRFLLGEEVLHAYA